MNERRDRKRKGLEAGSDAAAGVGGAAAGIGGTALLGPIGALLGPLGSTSLKQLFARLGVEQAFKSMGAQFAERQLGPVELARVESAYTVALRRIAERLQDDEGIRDDGFFDEPRAEDRPAAEELLESVLHKAQHAYEQRKADRLGELYAFVAFNPDIRPAHANYLLELASRLTWEQLLLLAVFAMEDRSVLPDWDPTGMFTRHEASLVFAIQELVREGLLVRDDNRLVTTFADVNPRQLRTVLNGLLLYDGMNLRFVEEEDLQTLVRAFGLLGKVRLDDGDLRVEAVVAPGSPPDTKLVKIGKQAVRMERPVIRLSDEELPDR